MLISLINELHVATEAGKGASEAKSILKKLINYAKAHFIYEESLFTNSDYVHTDEHLLSHRNIEGQLSELLEKSKVFDFDLSEELMVFLKNWLNNHILKEDMSYSEILVKNKVN